MSITLADTGTTLVLNPDLYWTDENNWHPVEQTAQRTITGALVVDVQVRDGGRPITLQPQDESSGWTTRAQLDQLRNWAAVAGKTLTLTLRGSARTVMFRHQDGSAVEAEPVVHFNDVESGDFYRATIRLMEVETP